MQKITIKECEIGLWAELESGWIVGPFVKTFDDSGVYVKFADTHWQLCLDDEDDSELSNSDARQIKRVGTREQLLENKND